MAGRALTAEPLPDPGWRRAWAAELTWPGSVIGFRTAGALHGFPMPARPPDPTDPTSVDPVVTVYSDAGHRRCQGLRAVRRGLPRGDVRALAGLLVTTRERTAVDLLATLPWTQALELYAWVSTRAVLTPERLAARTRERYGRWGTEQLLRLVSFTRDGAVSPGERLAHDLLRSAGLTGWRAGVEIRDGRDVVAVVDILFSRQRLVVEIDGWQAHRGREAFHRDRERQNRLIALGFRVVRLTWRDLTERPERTVALLRGLLSV